MIVRLATLSAVEQAVSGDPNWALIILIVAIVLGLAIFLLKPSKDEKAIESDEQKKLSKPKKKAALEDGTSKDISLENYEEKKENLSLAEIKVAKRQTAEEMSKEELRSMRKQKRAATQTEKAVKDRADAEVKVEAEVKADAEVEAKEAVVAAEAETETKAVEAEVKADAEVEAKEAVVAAEVEAEPAKEAVEAESKDVMSMFSDDDDEDLFGSFDDDDNPDVKRTVFPTLGSALISLDQLNKAAEAEEEADALSELTQRLKEKSEKKTLI